MPETEFMLGAWVYRRKSRKPGRNLEPLLAKVRAKTPHFAKRILALEMLRRGFFVKEIRVVTDDLSFLDEEEREMP